MFFIIIFENCFYHIIGNLALNWCLLTTAFNFNCTICIIVQFVLIVLLAKEIWRYFACRSLCEKLQERGSFSLEDTTI